MTVVMVEDLDPSSPDVGVPAHYGDPMREQRTLDTAAGLVDRSNRDVLAVPGEERASWLHTLTTQHLSDLRAGQGTELLVLSPHGHVEQHALVAEDGTTAWLDTEPGAGAGLLRYLEMMRFFTKVEPRDASAETAVFSLVGPQAVAAGASGPTSDSTPISAEASRGSTRVKNRIISRYFSRPAPAPGSVSSQAVMPSSATSAWCSTCPCGESTSSSVP